MNIQLNFNTRECIVTREPDDPKFYGAYVGESRLLYHIVQKLREQGHDVIKKRMWKDGHLVDDKQQYIRTRDVNTGFMIWNHRWNIVGAEQDYNNGQVILSLQKYQQ